MVMAEDDNTPKLPIGTTFDKVYKKNASKTFGKGRFTGSVVAFDAKSQKYRVKYHNGDADDLSWGEMREHLNLTKRKKCVHQIKVATGEIICTHGSMKLAAGSIGKSREAISQCCTGKISTVGGFKWTHADSGPAPRAVVQLSLSGKTLCVHTSQAAAAAVMGLKNCKRDIIRCCKGERCSVAGFKWRYATKKEAEA
jgi:hypothetical protein